MVKKGDDLIGLPVICLDDGCKTMEVKDILYCQRELKVVGLIVREGKYFQEDGIIHFEDLESIGDDAIAIKGKEAIEHVKSLEEGYGHYFLREKTLGLEVISEEGKDIGIVQDILIELPSGKILGLVLSEGFIDDLIGGRPILPMQANIELGKSTIIIDGSTQQSMIHNTGGLKKIFSLE